MNNNSFKTLFVIAALTIGLLPGIDNNIYAQPSPSGTVSSAKTKTGSVTYIIVPREGFDLDIFTKETGETGDFAGAVQRCADKKRQLVFAMNGAKCDKNLKPLGLLIKGLTKYKDFVRPDVNVFTSIGQSAVFAVDRNNIVSIIPAKNFKEANDLANYQLGVQSGTMLINKAFLNRDIIKVAEKQMYNGTGLKQNGDVVLAVTDDKMNLREFALFFEDMNCRDAMLLDAGASCQWYAPGRPKNPGKPGQIIVVTKK
jgi:uncharacterized protein YigE (DUF2233 family)